MRFSSHRRALFAAVLLFLGIGAPHAQTAPALTFTASTTSANGSLSTTLTWSAPGASGCTAAGHTTWSGAKPAAGTFALPTITLSGTYQVSLSCSWAGSTETVLTWTNPTTNTDGTAFTDPKLIRLRWGNSATSLFQVTDVPLVAGALPATYKFTGIPPGERFYAAYAVNQQDVESVASNLVSRQTTAAVSKTESIALTINPVPGPVTDLRAQ